MDNRYYRQRRKLLTKRFNCKICLSEHTTWDNLMMHYSAHHPDYKINKKSPIDNMDNKPKQYRKIPSFIKTKPTRITPKKKKRRKGLCN